MKTKLFLFLALAAIVTSCKTDEPQAFVIKDTDMISIRPAQGTAMKVKATEPTHLSALEIVKQVTVIQYNYNGIKPERSFTKPQRDTVSTTPKLLMWATDVITLDGQLQPEFIEATDVLFISYNETPPIIRDTIAYIPNSTLRAAETAIRAAYEAKDIEACYTAFNTAYTFLPITGAEWRTLKANGQN